MGRGAQERRRQQSAIGNDHADIDAEPGEALRLAVGFQGRGRDNREVESRRHVVHRRVALGQTAAGGTRRPGVDGGDLMPLADDLGQRGDREIRRSEESDAHGVLTAGHWWFEAIVSDHWSLC